MFSKYVFKLKILLSMLEVAALTTVLVAKLARFDTGRLNMINFDL